MIPVVIIRAPVRATCSCSAYEAILQSGAASTEKKPDNVVAIDGSQEFTEHEDQGKSSTTQLILYFI